MGKTLKAMNFYTEPFGLIMAGLGGKEGKGGLEGMQSKAYEEILL